MKKCEYCIENSEGYYKPLDKNAHICIFDTPHKKYMHINWHGHKMDLDINFCPICGRRLNKSDRTEYMKKYHREYYLKNKNPNAKKYGHKTEEEKKEYHRQAQKEHYKKYADKVKEKRMQRYYNNEKEDINVLITRIKRTNKQEYIDGEIMYHITYKMANKLINNYDIVIYDNKLYVGGI